MRVVIVGREFSDYNREVGEWTRECFERTGIEPEELNPDSGEGESFCRSRDIVQYPTIIVETDEGREVFSHVGTPLPAIDEAASFVL